MTKYSNMWAYGGSYLNHAKRSSYSIHWQGLLIHGVSCAPELCTVMIPWVGTGSWSKDRCLLKVWPGHLNKDIWRQWKVPIHDINFCNLWCSMPVFDRVISKHIFICFSKPWIQQIDFWYLSLIVSKYNLHHLNAVLEQITSLCHYRGIWFY